MSGSMVQQLTAERAALLDAMRERMRVMGAPDDHIEHMVDVLGEEAFIHHVQAVSTARAQADMVLDQREVAGARLFEFYLLMNLMEVDPAQPEAFNKAVATLHHLVDHSVELGCDVAKSMVLNDPLRLARQGDPDESGDPEDLASEVTDTGQD